MLFACQPKEQAETKVYGRYVPERKDDFAWENEYAAFRLYGPALLPENPSNGVDLWLKSSPELRVDSMYYYEFELGKPYHINYGKGLDCYKVAHTVGCGGLAVVAEDVLYGAVRTAVGKCWSRRRSDSRSAWTMTACWYAGR